MIKICIHLYTFRIKIHIGPYTVCGPIQIDSCIIWDSSLSNTTYVYKLAVLAPTAHLCCT